MSTFLLPSAILRGCAIPLDSVMGPMHDWTLRSLRIDWESGEVLIVLRGPHAEDEIRASGALEIHIPRALPWGPSVSINAVTGPTILENRLSSLDIEMQSGDTIKIVARVINMPDAVRNPD